MDTRPLAPLCASTWETERSWAGESCPSAALVCLLGFFLHIVISPPLLNSMGFHYAADEGSFIEKIHPGTYFIFAALCLLLWRHGNPFKELVVIYSEQTIFAVLLSLYIVLFVYVVLRGGGAGTAFLIDTHMTPPICAIVLSYAPVSYCRRAAHLFIVAAVVNSLIGIAESMGQFRIFTFDDTWVVLKEGEFRASAFLGHPLNNAMFSSIALFIAMAMPYRQHVKAVIAVVVLAGLVAFGGRSALVFSTVAVLGYFAISAYRVFVSGRMTMVQLFMMMAGFIAVPIALVGGLYLLINTGIGERIATHAQWDKSADTRQLVFLAFNYLSDSEVVLGIPTERLLNVAYRLGLSVPADDIENPWILMFMVLGAITFPIWLAATLAFIWRLMEDKPLAIKMAVLSYFLIASTSNSFGRKDSTYLIMVSAVMCASRVVKAVAIAKPPAGSMARAP